MQKNVMSKNKICGELVLPLPCRQKYASCVLNIAPDGTSHRIVKTSETKLICKKRNYC
jgi:hypothetical protein